MLVDGFEFLPGEGGVEGLPGSSSFTVTFSVASRCAPELAPMISVNSGQSIEAWVDA